MSASPWFKAGTQTAIEVEAAARTADVEAARAEATAAIDAEAGARAADAETFGQELVSANTQLVAGAYTSSLSSSTSALFGG